MVMLPAWGSLVTAPSRDVVRDPLGLVSLLLLGSMDTLAGLYEVFDSAWHDLIMSLPV